MPTSTYQVITSSVTVPQGTGSDVMELRVTAPVGKKPLSGGWYTTDGQLTSAGLTYFTASYPDGQDWVFRIVKNASAALSVTLYVVTATI